MFIYRPERHGIEYDPDTNENLRGTCDLIVRKNRNGKVGTVRLRHNRTFTKFVDAAQEGVLFEL